VAVGRWCLVSAVALPPELQEFLTASADSESASMGRHSDYSWSLSVLADRSDSSVASLQATTSVQTALVVPAHFDLACSLLVGSL